MRALGEELAIVHEPNRIRLLNRMQPMRDRDERRLARQLLNRASNDLLRH